MENRRATGQGSMEYLLILGGVVLVSVIIIAAITYIGPFLAENTTRNANTAAGLSDASAFNCGNGKCSLVESCSTCATDCGACNAPQKCGDDSCQAANGENCSVCPHDCTGVCSTPSICGNSVIEQGEDCDSANLGGITCKQLGYDPSTSDALSCTNCYYNRSTCIAYPPQSPATCNNDKIDGTDICDGIALGGHTCANLGFDSGALLCNATCSGFDVTQCQKVAPSITHEQAYYDFIEEKYLQQVEEYVHSGNILPTDLPHQPQYAAFDAFFATALPMGSTLAGAGGINYTPAQLVSSAFGFWQGTQTYYESKTIDFQTVGQVANPYLWIKNIPDTNQQVRDFVAALLPALDSKFAGTAEQGAVSRALERAYGEKLLSYLVPNDLKAAHWISDSDAVWNDTWQYGDTIENSSSANASWLYFLGQWTVALERFEPAKAQAIGTDPDSEFKDIGLRYLQIMAPIGILPSYGDSTGLNDRPGRLIAAFEQFASTTQDGRFKWAAKQVFDWTKLHLPLNSQSNIAIAMLSDLSDGYWNSDTTVPAQTPAFPSLVTYRHTVDWTSNAYPTLTAALIPDKLVLRSNWNSSWDPNDLFALVELSPPMGEKAHCDTASMSMMTAKQSVLLSTPGASFLDPKFHNSFLVLPPTADTPCSVSNMASQITAEQSLTENEKAVVASVTVSHYMAPYMTQDLTLHRRLFMLKNRFLWVADQLEAPNGYAQPNGVGPAWQTISADHSTGTDWVDTSLPSLPVANPDGLGYQLEWTNEPRRLLLVFPDQDAPTITVEDVSTSTETNPTDGSVKTFQNNMATRVWSSRPVDLTTQGQDKAEFSTILVPHDPSADAAQLAGQFEMVEQNSNDSILKTTSNGSPEFLGINANGNPLEFKIDPASQSKILTNAEWFYLQVEQDPTSGKWTQTNYWVSDATYLQIDGTDVSIAPQ
ncbi:MAG: hypothetical protein Q7R47_06405 [Candidatus Diapherotrites archaeon]|nr:hypothetical protein [Candidatus Diapherotrites archaeon]